MYVYKLIRLNGFCKKNETERSVVFLFFVFKLIHIHTNTQHAHKHGEYTADFQIGIRISERRYDTRLFIGRTTLKK